VGEGGGGRGAWTGEDFKRSGSCGKARGAVREPACRGLVGKGVGRQGGKKDKLLEKDKSKKKKKKGKKKKNKCC